VVANILRWSGNGLLVLLLTIALVITSFRLAASIRETGTRVGLAPKTGHLVPTRSGGVFVQEKGPEDGIPVVLFHGTAAWSELWRHTSDALADAGFHVIALDLPPFGFSDRPGSYTRQDQAARINDVLDALKAEPAIIVGHSFGAGAATELAMRYPDRTRALVLVDAALGLTAAPSAAPWVIQPQWIREILVSLTITNPVATQMLLQSMIADRNAYAKLEVPVAILWGDKDTITPVEQALDLRTLLPPETDLTLLPGLGHIPQIEDPAMFNDALLKTLGKL
jgi:pimeloyl-ACP methyl ester carboxylesterase